MSSGVSITGGSSDSVLENLAILADPTKFQERLGLLQKATLDATEAWTRIRKAETAEEMLKNATRQLAEAKKTLADAAEEASRLLKDAEQSVERMLKAAESKAEIVTTAAQEDASRLKTAALAAQSAAALKEKTAENMLTKAQLQTAALNEREAQLKAAQEQLERDRTSLEQREQDLSQKVAAIASVTAALGIK